MAINERPDVTCAKYWKHEPGPPAVALVRGTRTDSDGEWWPECQACLDELAADPDPLPHDVVYLDPARQRPSTVDDVLADLDRDGYAIVHKSDP